MVNHDEIWKTLSEVLGPLVPAGETLGKDTDLVGDLGLSSLKVMSLLMELEDRLDLTVPLNVLPDVRTAGELAAQLDKLVQEGS